MTLRREFWKKARKVRRLATGIPDTGAVDFGDLRRAAPISRHFGEDRGHALDRYYVERFLSDRSASIGGRVLEIGEDRYTRQFGGARVTSSDILHVTEGNASATIVADLAHAPQIPDARFDTLIVTQTLHLIYDIRAAVGTLHRILAPGGTLLVTVPGITQVPNGTPWAHTWYWSLTTLSVGRLLADAFVGGAVDVQHFGNVLSATAMLHGLAAEDLTTAELDAIDLDYPVIIGASARRGNA